MSRWAVFQFEAAQQLRSWWTWGYLLILAGIMGMLIVESSLYNATEEGYLFNSAFVIVTVMTIGSAMGLLMMAALASEAATRDHYTRIFPLVCTTHLDRGTYLGGRFAAAFSLSSMLFLIVPLLLMLSNFLPVSEELLGPVNPVPYVESLLIIALPNIFIATALFFSVSVLSRSRVAGFVAAALMFISTMFIWVYLAGVKGQWELAKWLDPLGFTHMGEISRSTSPAEKNMLTIASNTSLLLNRIVWMGLAGLVLTVTRFRFRFADPASGGNRLSRWMVQRRERRTQPEPVRTRTDSAELPAIDRSFETWTRLRQIAGVAGNAWRDLAMGWGGVILAGLAILLAVLGPEASEHIGMPMIPTTSELIDFVGNRGEILWMIIPLITLYFTGELVWRERDRQMNELSDTVPLPGWGKLVGKFLGLALILATYQLLLMVACILIQIQLGYYNFEPDLYLKIMLGIYLVEHLLFGALALVIHVLVNQKYGGYVVGLMAFGWIEYATALSFHNLLVYGAAPGWSWSDMRGFGPGLVPWLWFTAYWTLWAVLLGMIAWLFRVSGTDLSLVRRFRRARQRLSKRAMAVGGGVALLLLSVGGYIFYNTNILHTRYSSSEWAEIRVEYERRFAPYGDDPQPVRAGINLQIELYPDEGRADIAGHYRLVNRSGVPIDSVHVAPDRGVETGPMTFDRPARLVLDDRELYHRIYALGEPLQPGDTLQMSFDLRFSRDGFRNGGVDPSVAENATFFNGNGWLPGIGYQRGRELTGIGARREYDLPAREPYPALEDPEAPWDPFRAERVMIETVVGTAEGQTALAPGILKETWSDNGRQYYHYATPKPIRNDFAIYSADYSVRTGGWNGVEVEVFHHPGHDWNVDRIVRGAEASLDHFSRVYGPYAHDVIRFVEHPADGLTLHAYPFNISYTEDFSLLHPDTSEVDFPLAIAAHEVAHHWWGGNITPALVEGAPVLSEGLAWYSAFGVVEQVYGREHLGRLMHVLRLAYLSPRSMAGPPLMKAFNDFTAYRRGPFAMFAMREYVGEDRVNQALRGLLQEFRPGALPLPTTLDLHRNLKQVTPDSLQYLLRDLLEVNTYWHLETVGATAEPAGDGNWVVRLQVEAQKVAVDTSGVEQPLPMDDWVEIGVYASGDSASEPLYLEMHRIVPGEQTIEVKVQGEPESVGIDPRHLLIDVDPYNNTATVIRTGNQ